jgi:LysR family transcriptional regulator, flagellar master operon regulator
VEEYLLRWLPLMQVAHPEILIRAESALEPEIMQGLVEGRIDIGVMYTPQSRPGLKVEQLFEERLILVSTDPKSAPEPQPGYVYVDWGPEFYARHSAFFPNFTGPSLTANIGWLGLQHVLDNGGSGYFAHRIVEPLLNTRRLHAVAGAPEFSMSAYVVYPLDRQGDHVSRAIELMHRIADGQAKHSPEASVAKRGARKRR